MIRIHPVSLVVATVCFCIGVASYAQESTASATGATYLSALKACQTETEAENRLACFDREVAAIVGASDAGEVRVVAEEEVRQTRRGLFGFSLPKVKLFGSEGGQDMDRMESTVTRARQVRSDQWVFEIADGDAVWQITNAPMRLRKIKSGQKVVFKKASMGSYFIRLDGQLGVKGRRIR